MFELDGTRILLTRGDTGLLTIKVHSDHAFTEADAALFTVRRIGGERMAQMVLQPAQDGTVQIPLTSEMTGAWSEGQYVWDVRYVIDAVMEDGAITDGREVITPMTPGVLEMIRAVGCV